MAAGAVESAAHKSALAAAAEQASSGDDDSTVASPEGAGQCPYLKQKLTVLRGGSGSNGVGIAVPASLPPPCSCLLSRFFCFFFGGWVGISPLILCLSVATDPHSKSYHTKKPNLQGRRGSL